MEQIRAYEDQAPRDSGLPRQQRGESRRSILMHVEGRRGHADKSHDCEGMGAYPHMSTMRWSCRSHGGLPERGCARENPQSNETESQHGESIRFVNWDAYGFTSLDIGFVVRCQGYPWDEVITRSIRDVFSGIAVFQFPLRRNQGGSVRRGTTEHGMIWRPICPPLHVAA